MVTKILLHALGTITKLKKRAFSCKILVLEHLELYDISVSEQTQSLR